MPSYFLAHIGKEINRAGQGKLRRITALDPGWPGFVLFPDLVINKDDAEYVDVIHTDALVTTGWLRPMGHVDFYPNGGSYQNCSCDHPCPGVDCLGWSDHGRAPAYYEESILSQSKFPSWKCDMSFQEFLQERSCPFENDVTVSMGEWSNNSGAPEEGIYYLITKDESPYSCEEEECFIDGGGQ